MIGERRGQAFTLEGVIGAVLVLIAVVLALQAVDAAPFTDEESERRAEALRTQVADTLAVAADRGALRRAATCVRSGGDPHENVANPGVPVTDFGVLLNRTLIQNGNEYIATVEYRGSGGSGDSVLKRTRLHPATATDPPETAVAVTRQVVLHDSDPVFRVQSSRCGEDRSGRTLNESTTLYVDRHPDLGTDSPLYNVVRIRVTVW
jgi:hypothetical protein